LLLLAFLLFALNLYADKDLVKLTIEVKTLGGRPIDRASVIVRFIEGRSVIKFGKSIRKNWEIRTNQEGVAKIPPVPQGKILIQVIAKGYQTYGETHEFDEEEKTVEIKMNPPQAPYSAHQ
jgi:hypothetical protein